MLVDNRRSPEAEALPAARPVARAAAAVRPMPVCTVSAKTVRPVLSAAASVGVDPEALARAHGLALADLEIPDFRYPHARWIDLWSSLERHTGNPAVALETSTIVPLYWDTVDYLFGACATLGEAFARFDRHHALVSTAVRHVLRVFAVDAQLTRIPSSFATGSRAATEFALATIVRRFRILAARPWSPREVRFRHAPSAPLEVYRRVFGCDASFGCTEDALVLSRATLDIPMDRAAPGLVSVLEQIAESKVRDLPGSSDSVVERAQRVIATDLASGAPALVAIAKRLGMSARTLQRRLAEAGTPHRALVEQTRNQLACLYLADARTPLAEVGFRLGFADASAFYKAFRRWHGLTPGQYRRRAVRMA